MQHASLSVCVSLSGYNTELEEFVGKEVREKRRALGALCHIFSPFRIMSGQNEPSLTFVNSNGTSKEKDSL